MGGMFVGDLVFPAMLEARIVASPLAHAEILEIKAADALRLSGVAQILDRENVLKVARRNRYGLFLADQRIVADDRVRCVGDCVAVVAAEDALSAEQARDSVQVIYRELPEVNSVDDALRDGAVPVHVDAQPAQPSVAADLAHNICHRWEFRRGMPDDALAAADVVVDEVVEFHDPFVNALESFGVVAVPDGDRMTVWTANQAPTLVHRDLCDLFGIAPRRLRVRVPAIGGSFGAKCFLTLEPRAVALALLCGRPVRLVLPAEESMLLARRHPCRISLRAGATREGRLVALRASVTADVGAYATVGPKIAEKIGARLSGPYRIPHLAVEALAVYTNLPPASAYRGFGAPQATWAAERLLDALGHRVGVDPVAIRRKNLLRYRERHAIIGVPIGVDCSELLDRVARAVGTGKGRDGWGVSLALKDVAFEPYTASVSVAPDERVDLFVGTPDVGGHQLETLASIAADALEIDRSAVRVHLVDTGVAPPATFTGSSATTSLMGLAVARAAAALIRKGRGAVASITGVPPERIRYEHGVFHAGRRRMVWWDLRRERGALGARGRTARKGGVAFFEAAAAAARVSLDPETCQATITSFHAVTNVGHAISAIRCEGQTYGAVVGGIGQSLFEDAVFENAHPLNASPMLATVPTFTDLPPVLSAERVERGDGRGPRGARGMGQVDMCTVAPAVAQAIEGMVGAKLSRLPLTPEMLWNARRTTGHIPSAEVT